MKLPTKKQIKIFEAETLRQAIKNCLSEGYFPANCEVVFALRESDFSLYAGGDSTLNCSDGVLVGVKR